MMSGKALARAVRGHFLVDTALTAFILSLVYGIPVPIFESNPDDNGDKLSATTILHMIYILVK